MKIDQQIQKTLEDIKWLLALQLQRQGAPSKDIAQTLGVDPAVISRRLPRSKKGD